MTGNKREMVKNTPAVTLYTCRAMKECVFMTMLKSPVVCKMEDLSLEANRLASFATVLEEALRCNDAEPGEFLGAMEIFNRLMGDHAENLRDAFLESYQEKQESAISQDSN